MMVKYTEENEVDNGYWAVLELLGHVKVAGYITEEEAFGSKLGRIDIPSPAGGVLLTQFFGGASVYRITPTTEEVARAYAAATNAEPIALYELELPARAHMHELALNWHESGPVEYCATCRAAREVAGWSDDLVEELIAGMESEEPSAEAAREQRTHNEERERILIEQWEKDRALLDDEEPSPEDLRALEGDDEDDIPF